MKPIHIPRYTLIVILLVISAFLLVGTLRAFESVHATIPVTGGTLSGAVYPVARDNVTPTPETPTTPVVTPTPTVPSADTTGVIVMGIVIVVIVLLGSIWGARKPTTSKK